MEINHITITITPDELELLGNGLEESLRRQVAKMSRSSFDLLCEEEVNLLRQLVNCGYSMYLNAGKTLSDGRLCYDVDEFVDHLYNEKDSVEAEA